MQLIRQILLILALATASVSMVPLADASRQEAREGVDFHRVQSGDTLFGLAGHYMGDQLRWPQLWALNPHITNPHWLYPGDIVFLRDGVVMASQAAPIDRVLRSGDTDRLSETSGLYFPLGGVYTHEEFPEVGRLAFARTDRALLHPLDEVYLELEEGHGLQVGDELVIQRAEGRVYDRRELIGVRYRTTGRVRIEAFNEGTDLVTAVITALYDSIERDDVLFAARPQVLLVEPVPSTITAEGRIIDRLDPLRYVASYQVVFIDLGSDDGVRPGNRLQVWEREDMGAEAIGLARGRRYEEVQERLPWQNIGEGIVLATSERFSTVALLNTSREISVGHRFTFSSGL